jgi:hypothetical protein
MQQQLNAGSSEPVTLQTHKEKWGQGV